jgi:signal transduction histidine kinase/ligand-binding sensor domain-containing protein/CheY-like chemotaxis protein/AraC-like DNA-binding protein
MKKSFLALLFLCLFCRIGAFNDPKFHTLSHRGGLSYDGITDIKQDGQGFMWILQGRDLFRFDGYSYRSYKDCFYDSAETPQGYFNNLVTDHQGNIYASIAHGLYQYDYSTDNFSKIVDTPQLYVHIDSRNRFWFSTCKGFSSVREKNTPPVALHFAGNSQSLHKWIICEEGDDLYFFSLYGKVYRYNPTGNSIDEWGNFEKEFESASLVSATVRNGALWLLTNRFSILKIDLQTGKIVYRYRYPHFDNINIRCFYVSDEQTAWIGAMNGLYILNTETDAINLCQKNKNESFSLPHNSVWTISEDNRKNVWIGTYMGSLAYVNKYEKKIFETFYLSPGGLNRAPVSGFTEEGNRVWISTEGGGVNILDRSSHHFTYLQKGDLSSNNTKTSVTDSKGNVWIATYRGGLTRCNPSTRQFTHFRSQPGSDRSLYSDNLRKVVLEADSGLWVVYLEHTSTISYFSFRQNRFFHTSIDGEVNSYDYIFDACHDSGQRLWLITSCWLFSLDTQTKIFRKYPIPAKNNPASTLCIDDRGAIWIGTLGNELLRFDPDNESFLSFPDILQSDIAEIYSINQSLDQNGDQIIWLGTNDGLYMFNTATRSIAIFRESDGTQGDVYYPLSTIKNRDGLLYFGGTGGFTIIDPQKVAFNPVPPRAIISDFYIDNQSVLNNSTHREKVEFSNNLSKIKLSYTQQNIGFKLSSDNYLNVDKNMFRYRLKNYDNRWILTDASNRTVFYSKIPAGKYTFELQTANNDGLWGDISSIYIVRKQTPWLSIPAFALYFALLCALSCYLITSGMARKKLQVQLYIDQVEKEKNEEIHENQLQFFTNISHDLKTPLSLIMITINKMREEGMREYYYRILNNNSQRLLRLLNDILDFRKIQNNKVQLTVARGNLGEFIQTIAGDFLEYARQKEINYQIIISDEELSDVPFDKRVMEKLIMNLLINAFKYTRKGDSISITAGTKEFKSKHPNSHTICYDASPAADRNTFSIAVSDTGVGISKESISKVFERFYRVKSKNQHNHLGTGIGLALVKNLVLLHKGSITIYSKRHAGSDFVIKLPLSPHHYLPGEIHTQDADSPETANNTAEDTDSIYPEINCQTILADDLPPEEHAKGKTLLLAEDNAGLRMIIKSSLREQYEIIDFDDGKPALEYLKDNDVDLILSDIIMPEVDGITFCRAIKRNMETSHIPFILLTAKSGIESMLEGSESGVDLYFEKPIDMTLLKTSIANIFKQREALREYYAKNYFAETANIPANRQDNLFLKEISGIIDENLDQSDLDVNTIAAKMLMSRSKLYSKLKALTGKSVVEFILSYRLRRAAKFLTEGGTNIQQVMYAVGIESQSYFTKAFKKEFNMTPSQFLLKNRENPGLN